MANKIIDPEYGWATNDEIKFLSGLGGHSERGKYVPKSVFLKNYILASRNRNWGRIDSKVALGVASEILKRELFQRNKQYAKSNK